MANTDSIVYYIRRGKVIKIGTTTRPVRRFAALMPDEILAWEPGTDSEEGMRHQQFFHLRCRGEHFRPAPELLEHIQELRRIHGDPDPSWPTVADLEKPRQPERVPARANARRGSRKAMAGRYCSQHERPRETCPSDARHTQPLRCSDELFAMMEAAAAAMGLDRNAGLELAIEEFVQAHGTPETGAAAA